MSDIDELYESIVLANEAYIANTATEKEKLLLSKHRDIHIEVLKSKKRDVEYQFAAHKVIMQEYTTDYLKGNLTKAVYFDAMLEEQTWRAKAVSYLSRIDNKIIELKCKQKICQNKSKEKSSSTN